MNAELPEFTAIHCGGQTHTHRDEELHCVLTWRVVAAREGLSMGEARRICDTSGVPRHLIDLVWIDGFVTTHGRFVDRAEAYRLLPPDLKREIHPDDPYLDAFDLYQVYDFPDFVHTPMFKDPSIHPHYAGKLGD